MLPSKNIHARAAHPFALAVALTACSAFAAIATTGNVQPDDPSTWTSSSTAFIGRTSDGSLTVDTGSVIQSNSAHLGYSSGVTGTATVNGAGSSWTSNLLVGYNGAGTLAVQAGGQITSSTGYLGYSVGSTGMATITGAGSLWTSSSALYLGYYGAGTLNVLAGGKVANTVTYVGYNGGSTGDVTVNGAGSTWTNSSSLYVGCSGSGTLTVSDGGLVTAKTLYANLASLAGNGTITVSSGAVLDANLVFDSTHGPTQSIPFGSGGTLNLTVAGDSPLGVGHQGTGALQISQGVSVQSSTGNLGSRTGSTGTAVVSGAGSTWANSSTLYVGDWGTGSLSVEAGGQITSSSGYIGNSTGGIGSVSVSGAGSRWTNSANLAVGYMGTGTLAVSDGGLVTTMVLYANLSNLAGNGTITVTHGAILDTNLVFDSTHGTTQAIPFGSGGTLNLTVAGDSPLGVGYQGTGTLRIDQGVTVQSSAGSLGIRAGSTGAATVTGAGSTWTNSWLWLGEMGTGIVDIRAGGQVTSYGAYVGVNAGTIGTATVSGTDSKWTLSNPVDGLCVGRGGAGELIVEAGGQVISAVGYVGYESKSTGTATVTGSGSMWVNAFSLSVGYNGAGTMTVAAGGQVSSSSASLGANVNSTGTATVTGTGSAWSNSGDLYVGRHGTGILTVSDGGLVTAKTLYASLGNLTGNGTITVGNGAILDANLAFDSTQGTSQAIPFGTGGTLNLTVRDESPLGVGYRGSGALQISQGVTVASANGYLGYNANATGTATVTGIGSTWVNVSSLYVGYNGVGAMTVEAGGRVIDSKGYLGANAGAIGSAIVTGAGSAWDNSLDLVLGYSLSSISSGTLTITQGGSVSSGHLSIVKRSLVALSVGDDSSLTLGSGTLLNNGTIRLQAAPGAATGVYTPITAGAWSGSGVYQAMGGIWNATAHQFAVSAPATGNAGDTLTINRATTQRLLITDPATSGAVALGFTPTVTTSTLTLAATPLTYAQIAQFHTTLPASAIALTGWSFTPTGYTAGDPVYLSIKVGAGQNLSGLSVWHFDGSAWSAYAARDFSYDGQYASFTVTGFSGYALARQRITSAWRNTSGDNLWTTTAGTNWAPSVPGLPGDAATFDDSVTGGTPGAVSLNGPKTLASLTLASLVGGYTLGQPASTDRLSLDNGPTDASITVSGTQVHTINAPVALASDTTISVGGTAAVDFAGGIDNTAGKALSLTGAGNIKGGSILSTGSVTVTANVDLVNALLTPGSPLTVAGQVAADSVGTTLAGTLNVLSNGQLTLSRIRQESLIIGDDTSTTGAKVTIAESTPGLVTGTPAGDNAYASVVRSLSIHQPDGAYVGTLDLNNNDLIIDYTGNASPLADIEAMLRSGYNAGTWTGKGLTSSTAAADSGSYALVVLDNAQRPTPFTIFDDISVPTTVVIVKFSWIADLDLDGIVTSNDAIVFANNYAEGAPATHRLGDLNYNGVFDSNDAILFANAYNETLPHLPEPASLSLLALAAPLLLARRRNVFTAPPHRLSA